MDYLFFLQNLREASPQWLNEAILFVSEFSAGLGGLAVMALVYWCLNKRAGIFVMMNFGFAYICNTVVKNYFCVDRPFNRDARLTPYVDATGYSFPSGHTMLATGFYGGLAVWQRKRKWLAVCLGMMALLTGFTRNWLGAHTLEDVVVGVLLSCGVIALNAQLLRWTDRNPAKDVYVFAAAMILCVIFCIAYPSGAKPAGIYGGVMLGWFLERRWIRFEIGGSTGFRAGMFAAGILLVGAGYKLLWPAVFAPLGSWASMANNFATFLLITAGWPLVIKHFGKKEAANRSVAAS